MAILKKREAAILITVLLIILGIFVGSRADLNKLRDAAESYFTGDPASGIIGIKDDLADCAEAAYSLTIVAARSLSENDEGLLACRSYCEELKNAEDASLAFAANQKLGAALSELIDRLSERELSYTDTDYVRSLYDQYQSGNLIIARSKYNDEASAFNGLLRRFPTFLCAKLAFVKDLPLYE